MSGGMTLRRNKRGNMHFNVICVSYSDKDDTDMMMGAHTVDDSNLYRSAELDYYTRVPLPLKDGTKEDVTRGGLVPLDGQRRPGQVHDHVRHQPRLCADRRRAWRRRHYRRHAIGLHSPHAVEKPAGNADHRCDAA